MSGGAIIMMVVAIATLWGGLAVAAVNLFRRPDLAVSDDEPPPSA